MNFQTMPAHRPFFAQKCGVMAHLIETLLSRPERILVVGCGAGVEAAELAHRLSAQVVGIDMNDDFDPRAAQYAQLQRGDATALEFPDASFDHVYSYHALEHIPDYRQALREMRRVLTASGTYCIGTPNKSRCIGYLGSTNASLGDIVRWNLNDWRRRLTGTFHNEFGAHAGFTREHLAAELGSMLGQPQDITLAYYEHVYSSKAGLVRIVERSGLGRYVFPSVYFVGAIV